MPSTFTTNYGLEEPGLGDYVNSWENPVNSNFTVIDAAIGGSTTVAFTSSNVTLTVAQSAYFSIVCTGTLTANVKLIFPATIGGRRVIFNNCSGAHTLTVLNGVSDSGGGVVCSQGTHTPVLLTQGIAYLDATGSSVFGPASSTNGHIVTFGNSAGNLIADSGYILPASAIVGLTDVQTLTNKTLSSPSVSNGTFSGTNTFPTQSVNDSSTKAATTAFANPSSSISANGYVELPSGIIIQWGTTGNLPTGSNKGQLAFTFPEPFPNACFSISGNPNNSASSVWTPIIVIFLYMSTTGATVLFDSTNTGQSITNSIGVTWIAIGH